MPSSSSTLMTPPSKPSVFPGGQGGQQFEEAPIGPQSTRRFGMLHLAAHHHLGDAFLLQNVDELAELPKEIQ